MAKSELKTKETNASVEDFIGDLTDETVRDDCRKLSAMMSAASGAEPKMWGANIVGFGLRQLKYASGRALVWFVVGFAPRKGNLTLYLSNGEDQNEDLLSRLGKHKLGKGCLYVKRLADVDEEILKKLIEESVERAKN